MSAPGLKITNFHYSHMTLPTYTVHEYPKWIHMSGYPSVIAKDAEEEAALLARTPTSGDVTIQLQGAQADAVAAPIVESGPTLQGPNDERELLLKIAEEKGIKIDKRWNLNRLRATVERETSQWQA
jgi:hypothetical protein